MKKRDLVKLLEKNGFKLVRDGGNHNVYSNGKKTEAVPRHNEVSEGLAKAIIKRNDLK